MYRLDDLLQIGDAATLKGVSINTLRRWEVDGKILPVRTEGGHRRYKLTDIDRSNQCSSPSKQKLNPTTSK